jgi:hypothetical protein
MIVAVGSLAATEVRAQEDAAGSGATAPSAQQDDAAGNEPSDKAQSKASTKSDPSDYGTYVDGPATVDADGVPVPKPNPMSEFRKSSRTFDNVPIEMPLVDDPRTDGSATDGQTK